MTAGVDITVKAVAVEALGTGQVAEGRRLTLAYAEAPVAGPGVSDREVDPARK